MEKQREFGASHHERTVISIMRRLSPEHVAQLVNFAHFLELQATQAYKKYLEGESSETGDEKWEKLFADSEAKRVMREMAYEAREAYYAGQTTDIEITEDERLSPA